MATLTLRKIKCYAQEDWVGDDEIIVVVHGADKKNAWKGDMEKGQTRDLGNVKVDFTGSARIQLLEEDWPDGDDDLGSVTVSESSSAAVDREARFTGDDANYTVWYRISTESKEPPTHPEHDHTCDPPEKNPWVEWFEDLFESWTGTPWTGGKTKCPLGSLAAKVKDADGNAIQGAQVRLVETGQTGVTDSKGIFDFGMLHEGDYTCEASKDKYAPNPASEVGHVTADTSSEVPLTLAPVKVVKVLPDADHKHYINLDQDESKKQGRELTIKAQVEPKIKNIRVYFELEEDGVYSRLAAGHRLLRCKAAGLTFSIRYLPILCGNRTG